MKQEKENEQCREISIMLEMQSAAEKSRGIERER